MGHNKLVRLLTSETGLVNQELLLQNDYLAAENRILRAHLPVRLCLSDPERSTLADLVNPAQHFRPHAVHDRKGDIRPVKAGATIETGVPKPLFQTPLSVVFPREDQYCVTADGRRFLIGEPVADAAKPTTVVLNWTAGLKR